MNTPIDPVRSPSADQFARALASLAPLPGHHLAILRFHYGRPRRTTTATEVAKHMQYANHSGANLHYGGLASKLCATLGRREVNPALCLLVTDTSPTGAHLQLTMRPELAAALEQLCLVKPAP